MPWKPVLFIITAIVIVCDGKDPKSAEVLTLKYIYANDDADNKQDTFKISFESPIDVSSFKEFRLDLLDLSRTPPFEKVLVANEITVDDNVYSVVFPYMGNDIEHDVHELLEKKFNLILVIKDGGDNVAEGINEVDLLSMTEFPKNSGGQYVLDSTIAEAGWIRITTNGLIFMGSTLLTPCEDAPCYSYQETLDKITNYRQCVDVKVEKEMYFCSDGTTPLQDITKSDANVPKQIILDHADKIQVIINEKKDATTIDMVIYQSTNNEKYCSNEALSSLEVTCELDGFDIVADTSEYKILLVGYDGKDIKWTMDYTEKNHNLQTEFIIPEIFEVNWDHEPSGVLQYYHVTRAEKGLNDSYHEANVDCSAVGDPCFSYFIDIKNPGSYFATLQNCDEAGCTTKKEKFTIKSVEDIRAKLQYIKVIDIPDTNIDIKMVDSKANVEVCFEPIKNISLSHSQYEFLAINSRGQWKRTTEVHMETNSFSCFHSVELPDAYFKENSKAFILLRNTKDRSILASGQVRIAVQESSLDHTGDNMSSNSGNTVWMIVGTSVGFLACLVALVALIYTKFIRKVGSDDGIEHPLHSTIIENSNIIHGFDNPVSTK